MQDLQKFKNKILANIDTVAIDFEVGYCYKMAIQDGWDTEGYWVGCYNFLKGVAHYKGIVCLR